MHRYKLLGGLESMNNLGTVQFLQTLCRLSEQMLFIPRMVKHASPATQDVCALCQTLSQPKRGNNADRFSIHMTDGQSSETAAAAESFPARVSGTANVYHCGIASSPLPISACIETPNLPDKDNFAINLTKDKVHAALGALSLAGPGAHKRPYLPSLQVSYRLLQQGAHWG